MYGPITTAKLNDVDPQAWLADVLARIAVSPASRLDDLMPWDWNHAKAVTAACPGVLRAVARPGRQIRRPRCVPPGDGRPVTRHR